MNTTHHTRDYSCSASEQRFKGSATATPGQLVIGAHLSSNEPGLVSILALLQVHLGCDCWMLPASEFMQFIGELHIHQSMIFL